MLKIRRPLGRLIFNMGIAISGKTVFLIETAPWASHVNGNSIHYSTASSIPQKHKKYRISLLLCPLWLQSSGYRWIPLTKSHLCGKHLHVTKSSSCRELRDCCKLLLLSRAKAPHSPCVTVYLINWHTTFEGVRIRSRDHDDVIKWKQFPRYWPFVRGIHRSPVNSVHKGQWRKAFLSEPE